MEMEAVLHRAIDVRASDIFIIAGLPLTYKVNGRQLREGEMLTPADTARLVELNHEKEDIAAKLEALYEQWELLAEEDSQ